MKGRLSGQNFEPHDNVGWHTQPFADKDYTGRQQSFCFGLDGVDGGVSVIVGLLVERRQLSSESKIPVLNRGYERYVNVAIVSFRHPAHGANVMGEEQAGTQPELY